MKQRLVIALLAVLCFGAGFAARTWTEEGPSVPPPPPALGSEFTRSASAPADARGARRGTSGQPLDRAKLVAEIEHYRSEIAAYKKRLEEIDAEFDRDLAPMLTADQREHFATRQKRDAERRAKGEAAFAADTAPLSDERIFHLQQRPLYSMLGAVSLTMRFDSLTKDLKLDEAQQGKLRDLLRVRREKFIALVDSTPPPSIMLSRLAPVAQKLAAEPAKK